MVANDFHHYDNSRDNRFGSDVPDLNSLIVLLLALIILLVLTNKLPLLLSGIVGGASLQGGGFRTRMITGAANAISGAGTMAMSATAQFSGGASALKAAFESAQTAMAEESRSAGDGSGGGFGGGEDTGSVDISGEQPSGKDNSSGEGKVLLRRSRVLAAWQTIWEAAWLTELLNTRQ